MAGKPILRKLALDIERDGGDIAVFSRILDGEPIGKIAKRYGVARPTMYAWRDKDPERKRLWVEAVKMSAEAWAEDAGTVLDDLAELDELTAPRVTLAVARSKHKQWQAATRNPEAFGEKKDPAVVMNVQHLHLDALRQIGRVQLSPPVAEAEIQEAEIEVLGSGEGDEDEDEDVAGAFNQ